MKNKTTDNKFPKTLEIRNTPGGMIWQLYHVNNKKEAEVLSKNASINGFLEQTLVDYREDKEETFPDWRETCCTELKDVLT